MDKNNERLYDIVKDYENAVYIKVSDIGSGDNLAYHLGDCIGIVVPSVNVGMYQDSVLYIKYSTEGNDDCEMDFRYFPNVLEKSMETYSWSDNIERAIIKNEGVVPISFNRQKINPGETKVFTPDGHRQGLMW